MRQTMHHTRRSCGADDRGSSVHATADGRTCRLSMPRFVVQFPTAFLGKCSAGVNVKGGQTVPGSYLTPSGGTGDWLGGRRTLPTASERATRSPRRARRGKRKAERGSALLFIIWLKG